VFTRDKENMNCLNIESKKIKNFPFVFSEDVVEILDGGRAYDNGRPPDTIRFNGENLPNPRKHAPPQSMLGAEQKEWFLERQPPV
jgi:alkaline phosphatase D